MRDVHLTPDRTALVLPVKSDGSVNLIATDNSTLLRFTQRTHEPVPGEPPAGADGSSASVALGQKYEVEGAIRGRLQGSSNSKMAAAFW